MPTYQLGLQPARGVINVANGADLIFVLKKQDGDFPETTTAALHFNQSGKIIPGEFTEDYVVFRMEYAQSDLLPTTETWRLIFSYTNDTVTDDHDDYCVMTGTLKRYT